MGSLGLTMPTCMCTCPENSVKIGPRNSEIIGLQGSDRTVKKGERK